MHSFLPSTSHSPRARSGFLSPLTLRRERERERREFWICLGRFAQSLLHGTPQEMRDYSVFCALSNILVCLAYTEASHKRNEEKCMLTTRLRAFAWWLIQSGSVMSTDKAGDAETSPSSARPSYFSSRIICSTEKRQEPGRTGPTAFHR